MGLKSPKVETRESIIEFLTDNGSTLENQYLLICSNDSADIMKNMMKCFNSEVFLFDKNGSRYCYKGDKICAGFQLSAAFGDFENNYKTCNTNTLFYDSLIMQITPLNHREVLKDTICNDYFLFMYWSKFLGGKKRVKEEMEWVKSLQDKSSKKIKIIFVNTDLQDSWGLTKGGKMKLNFRLVGKRSGELELGAIPY